MKTLVLKICALVAVVAGLELLGIVQPAQLVDVYEKLVPPRAKEIMSGHEAKVVGALALVIFGLYAFLPKLPSGKKKRSVSFTGDHGDVVVHLDMVESTLTRVLSRMPEVKKIKVRVTSDGKGRKATITADCVLHDRPEVPARQAADAVNEYLSEAAGNILGVEDLHSVKLNIIGVDVNPKASSLYLEQEHAARVKALEAKRLPPAPGLVPGAPALPEEPAAMPYVPSQAVPYTAVPEAEPVVDTANLNVAPIADSENTDPALSTNFEPILDEHAPKVEDRPKTEEEN